MILEGFGISHYRSFGSEFQKIYPLEKLNIIIGQNNCGKSNIIRFLVEQVPDLIGYINKNIKIPNNQLDNIDLPLPDRNFGIKFGVSISNSGPTMDRLLEASPHVDQNTIEQMKKLFTGKLGDLKDNSVWFIYETHKMNEPLEFSPDSVQEIIRSSSGNINWNLGTKLAQSDWSGKLEVDVLGILKGLSPLPHLQHIKADLIPAVRSTRNYTEGVSQEGDVYKRGRIIEHSGIGLIDELFRLQNPSYGQEKEVERFQQINEFIREVTGDKTATLIIPHDKNMIIVEMEKKRLPINALGSGIEEVIIIAVKSTIFQNQIVCIEEPEIHLHPALQRKLIRYLYEKTENQYFITTHSAHLLDAAPCAVFHVQLIQGKSFVKSAVSDKQKFAICSDLGYHASDILQANCIVWVEGPSDRLYINHWLNKADSKLVEGLHYSIMFYGGRLLSHLSANDNEVSEFISLKRLNQNIAIVIDSDRKKRRDRLNKTKIRVRKELEKRPGFVWVTEGREIENYIPKDLLHKAIKSCHSKAKVLPKWGQYEKLTQYRFRSNGKAKPVDKIKVAHYLTANDPNLDVLDLNKQVKELIKFIRKSNPSI